MWQLFFSCKFYQFMLMINNIFAFLVAPSSCTCIYMFDYSKYIHTQFPPKLTLTRRWLNYKAFSSSWLNRFQASTSIDGGDVNNILLICLKKKKEITRFLGRRLPAVHGVADFIKFSNQAAHHQIFLNPWFMWWNFTRIIRTIMNVYIPS